MLNNEQVIRLSQTFVYEGHDVSNVLHKDPTLQLEPWFSLLVNRRFVVSQHLIFWLVGVHLFAAEEDSFE